MERVWLKFRRISERDFPAGTTAFFPKKSTLGGDYRETATITPGGQDALSYADWISRYFTRTSETY